MLFLNSPTPCVNFRIFVANTAIDYRYLNFLLMPWAFRNGLFGRLRRLGVFLLEKVHPVLESLTIVASQAL